MEVLRAKHLSPFVLTSVYLKSKCDHLRHFGAVHKVQRLEESRGVSLRIRVAGDNAVVRGRLDGIGGQSRNRGRFGKDRLTSTHKTTSFPWDLINVTPVDMIRTMVRGIEPPMLSAVIRISFFQSTLRSTV